MCYTSRLAHSHTSCLKRAGEESATEPARERERVKESGSLISHGMAGNVDNADLSKAQQQQLQRPTVYLSPREYCVYVCVCVWHLGKSALAQNSKGFRVVVTRAIGQAGTRPGGHSESRLGNDSSPSASARLHSCSAWLLLLPPLLPLLLLRGGSCRPLGQPGSTVGYEF